MTTKSLAQLPLLVAPIPTNNYSANTSTCCIGLDAVLRMGDQTKRNG